MSLTLDEIIAHEDRLRCEIVERECFLAALNVLHRHAVNGHVPSSVELGRLAAVLVPSQSTYQLTDSVVPETTSATPKSIVPEAAVAPTPAPLPGRPGYLHPELAAVLNGGNGAAVNWAIQLMTEDYTVTNVKALLWREGCRLSGSQVSAVLTRMKKKGDIEEITGGRGRRASVYRKPVGVVPPETEANDAIAGTESPAAAAV